MCRSANSRPVCRYLIPANTVSAATNNTLFLNLGQTNVPGRAMTFIMRYNF